MRIAIFASAFYPHIGGVEELVRQLAHAYRRTGDTAIVLTNRWPRDLPEQEEYEGITIYRLPMRVPDGGLKTHLNYHLTHASICREMLGILRRHEIEILHIQCVSSNGYYALLAKRALGLPLVVSTQGERTMDAGRIYQKSRFMNAVLRDVLAEAAYITACSQNTLDDVEQFFGESFGDRAKVVYNGIQMSDFEGNETFAHPRPYVLGIGRLAPQKGFDILLEAFAKARLETHDLLLAGEGPERNALEAQAQRLGLEGKVHFLGRADRPTAVTLFKGCSFFVLPSRQEPQGIVNLEAMAAGKAVVASRVGGVPEIVLDGQTGVLFTPEDVPALTDLLLRLSSDEGLRNRLGEAGRKRAAQFDWATIASCYRDIYQAVSAAGEVSPAAGAR